MYIIGERINGMFKSVKKAIQERDASVIQDLAKRQVAGGASALDLNVGPAVADAVGAMIWLAECVREVDPVTPLAVDTAKWEVMEAVIPKIQGPVILNSSKADPEILMPYIELAVAHDAGLIGLTIDADGVPGNIEKRVELGANIVALSMEGGIPIEKIFVDPIILPVNVSTQAPGHVMESLSQLKMFCDPPPHLLLGLSNVSQKCANRSLINSTYVAMAIAHGLDAAILDPLDTDLVNSVITADLLNGKMIYCDSFLEAAR